MPGSELAARHAQNERTSWSGCGENERLRRRLTHVEADLEQARAGKRQAAPFSKGNALAITRRPGRRAGENYGQRAHRAIPERVDREVEVGLPDSCPHCGGAVEHERTAAQYQEDLPDVRPMVTRFRVHIGHCQRCGRRVQARHPEQTSDALGAAATQVGPRALALAVQLNKTVGASVGKNGGHCAAGEWHRPDARRAEPGAGASRAAGHPDLRRPGRGRPQESCGGARHVPLTVRQLLLDGLALRVQRDAGQLQSSEVETAIHDLERRLDIVLAMRLRHPANRRLVKHLAHERQALFTYLRRDGVEATNWRAEQAIRPAVVNRKVWGGNRTAAGAHTQQVLVSVLRTCQQQARDPTPILIDLLRSPTPAVAPLRYPSGSAA